MKFIKHIFVYSIANIANAAIPFFLLPVFTKFFTPDEYGTLSLISMLQALLLPIFFISNIHGLISVEYSRISQEQFTRLFGMINLFPLFGFALAAPPLYYFRAEIAKLFCITPFWVIASTGFVLLQAFPSAISSLFQTRGQPKAFGIFKIGLTLTNMLFSILFVVQLNYGWEGRMLGIFVSQLLFNLVAIVILAREKLFVFRFDDFYFREAIKFGIPIIPHMLSGTLLGMADRLFLANLQSSTSVGIYSVAYQVASVISIIMASINQAWWPYLFEQLNKNPGAPGKKKLVNQTYKIMALMLLITVLFIATIPTIYHFFISSKFHDGKMVATIISLAFMFQGFYFMVTNYIFYVKKTYLLSILTIVSALFIMGLNYIFIPLFGIIGSAFAMVTSWFFFFLLAWKLSHQVYSMPWSFKIWRATNA